MVGNAQSSRQPPFRVKTVRGQPYEVDGRKLVPVVRIVSFGRARGTIGVNGVIGRGAGFALLLPMAIEEKTAEGERRIATRDTTATVLVSLFGAAVVMTVFFAAARWLARWRRGAAVQRGSQLPGADRLSYGSEV
jgi:hypothetical protein